MKKTTMFGTICLAVALALAFGAAVQPATVFAVSVSDLGAIMGADGCKCNTTTPATCPALPGCAAATHPKCISAATFQDCVEGVASCGHASNGCGAYCG